MTVHVSVRSISALLLLSVSLLGLPAGAPAQSVVTPAKTAPVEPGTTPCPIPPAPRSGHSCDEGHFMDNVTPEVGGLATAQIEQFITDGFVR
jgi:hypothetical protein